VNTPWESGVQPFTKLRTLPKDSVVMIETQTRELGGSVLVNRSSLQIDSEGWA